MASLGGDAQPTVLNLTPHAVLLIVARLVAEAMPHRDDLLYPHDTVRDAGGVVIGCRSLARIAQPCLRPTEQQGHSGD